MLIFIFSKKINKGGFEGLSPIFRCQAKTPSRWEIMEKRRYWR